MSDTYRNSYAATAAKPSIAKRGKVATATVRDLTPAGDLVCEASPVCRNRGQLVAFRGLDSIFWPAYCSEHRPLIT